MNPFINGPFFVGQVTVIRHEITHYGGTGDDPSDTLYAEQIANTVIPVLAEKYEDFVSEKNK